MTHEGELRKAISEIDALNDQALHQRHLNGPNSFSLARLALDRSTQVGYGAGKARALLNLGFQELLNAQYDKAFTTFNTAAQICTELNDRPGIAHAAYDLGVLYSRLGDYENAMAAQQESLRIRSELGDADGVAACKSQTAYINAQFGLNDLALREYDECIGYWRTNGNRAGLAGALMALGNVKVKLNDLNAAREHLTESLNIRKELHEITGILGSSNYLADVLLKEGNTEEAHGLLTEALAVALNQPNPFAPGICRLRTNLAKACLQRDDRDSAIQQLEKALELAIDTKQLYQLHDIYFELSRLYKSATDYQTALDYHEKFHEAKQNVISLNAATKLKNLEMISKVELSAKELEIHRLKNIELKQRNKTIRDERKRSEELLLNILPRQTANELKKNGVTKSRQYQTATVLFTDFANFTETAEKLGPQELVDRIHNYFCAFDQIVTEHRIEKIKTLGDAYMAVGGVPIANSSNPVDVVHAALKIAAYVDQQRDPLFRIRVGVHTGSVIAGVVGNKKFAFDIWGDTVNIAARMESSGEAGKVNVSGTTYELIKHLFECVYRGKIEAKRKGMIDMYFVERLRPPV